MLEQLVLDSINKVTTAVRENETEFVKSAMQNSKEQQSAELKVAKKKLTQSEKRIAELDKIFSRLFKYFCAGGTIYGAVFLFSGDGNLCNFNVLTFFCRLD